VVFYPGAQAIHYMGTSTTKKDPVRYGVMQQRSILRYWGKFHGLAGRLSIGCLMFCNLLTRWCAACVKSILAPASRGENRLKMRISSACLGALLGAGSEPESVKYAG
jgi:GT2 family glycosyltransferase